MDFMYIYGSHTQKKLKGTFSKLDKSVEFYKKKNYAHQFHC